MNTVRWIAKQITVVIAILIFFAAGVFFPGSVFGGSQYIVLWGYNHPDSLIGQFVWGFGCISQYILMAASIIPAVALFSIAMWLFEATQGEEEDKK